MESLYEKNVYSYMKKSIEEIYGSFGYDEIDIPLFTSAQLYEKYKGVPGSKFVKFLDRNGKVIVIRPDATFHILKKVNANGIRKVQRFYYHTEIVRYKSDNHEDNEIIQSGVEFFNDNSPFCDSEVIAIAIKSLLNLGIYDIRVDIGHSDYIYALFDGNHHLNKADLQKIHTYIAQKNTVDLKEFLQIKKVEGELSEQVMEICMLFGDYETVRHRAEQLCVNDKMLSALENIHQIYTCLKSYGLEQYIYLDLGFSNPMEYYSGMIFKIYAQNAKEEIISGGRYDQLASKFGLRKYACGFGHNLNLSSELIKAQMSHGDERVVIQCPPHDINGIAAAEKIRAKGFPAVLNEGGEKLTVKYKNRIYTDAEDFLNKANARGKF